jgi:hypothetical protein
MAHFEDYELAQAVHAELMKLRSRPTTPTDEEIMIIARKAGITSASPRSSRKAVDDARHDAWLAISKLAEVHAENAAAGAAHTPGKIVETSPFWATAIDLAQGWVRAAE